MLVSEGWRRRGRGYSRRSSATVPSGAFSQVAVSSCPCVILIEHWKKSQAGATRTRGVFGSCCCLLKSFSVLEGDGEAVTESARNGRRANVATATDARVFLCPNILPSVSTRAVWKGVAEQQGEAASGTRACDAKRKTSEKDLVRAPPFDGDLKVGFARGWDDEAVRQGVQEQA